MFFSFSLLQYNIPSQSGEIPKSRSLERKQSDSIFLTKWRHSTYVLDLNDKVRGRYGSGVNRIIQI